MNRESLNWKGLIYFVSSLLLLVVSYSVFADVQTNTYNHIHASEPIDPDKLEIFIDNYLPGEMERWFVPGLIVVVVQNGEVLLSKGYGYADLENKIPMTPSTQIRAGSVSKPVTASVVLQLAAKGMIELHAPVSNYIDDLVLSDDYGEASTTAQLLNHMSGYPDQVVLSHAPTIDEWQPLKEVLVTDLPSRTFAPGIVMSYSSWDYALLGYMIEQIVGRPYEDAINELLLSPLGMQNSTYLQPLPEEIFTRLAVGYGFNHSTNEYDVVPHDFVRISPGVALVTNGNDMGIYMRTILNRGMWNNNQVLEPAAVDMILEQMHPMHLHSRGRSYAFAELNIGGRQVLYHDGNGIGFICRMVIMPEQNLGIFISANHRALWKNAGPTKAYSMVRILSSKILSNFVPESEMRVPKMKPMVISENDLERFEGHYQTAHLPRKDFFKLEGLLDNVNVKKYGNETLMIGSGIYRKVESLIFQHVKTPASIVVFVENDKSEVEFLTFGGTASYRKVAWYQSMIFQIALVLIITLVSLSIVIIWPLSRQGHWIALVTGLLNLGVLLGVGLLLGVSDLLILFKTIPLWIRFLMVLPWIIGILSIGLLVFLAKILRDKTASLWGKVHYSLLTLVSFALLWVTNFWNLILK